MNRKKVGLVDFYEDDSDDYVDGLPDKRRECENCFAHGIISKLGPRTWSGKKRPSDWDLLYNAIHAALFTQNMKLKNKSY